MVHYHHQENATWTKCWLILSRAAGHPACMGKKKQAHKTAFGKSYNEITWGICTYCEQRNKEIHFKEKGCENQDWIIVAQEEALCIICNHRGEALGFTTA